MFAAPTRPGRRVAGLPALLGLPAAAALCAPGAAPAAKPADTAGVAVHPWRLTTRSYASLWPLRDPTLRERTFSRLARAGVRRVRVDLKWGGVERYNGNPLLRDWHEFDGIAVSARRWGIELEPVVAFTPRWTGARHHFGFPPNPRHFENFLAAAMARYPRT